LQGRRRRHPARPLRLRRQFSGLRRRVARKSFAANSKCQHEWFYIVIIEPKLTFDEKSDQHGIFYIKFQITWNFCIKARKTIWEYFHNIKYCAVLKYLILK